MPMNFNAAPEDDHGYVRRVTGQRRSESATCYRCGEDVPDGPRFGAEATCDDCRRRGPVDPWLCEREER